MIAPRLTLAAALAAAFLAIPTDSVSCGPFVPAAVFVATRGPINPGAEYARNYVGIVRRDWRTEPLIMAWRYFSGLDLNAMERANLYPGKRDPNPIEPDSPPKTPLENWLNARAEVPDAPSVPSLDSYWRTTQLNEYISFQNCLDDSFRTATETLQARAAKWGIASVETKDSLAAQDAVFSNCSGPATEPEPARPTAPALLKADRAYQQAAALFYAGEYTGAHGHFLAIAKDTASPWHTNAAYLAARATLRDGTVNKNTGKLAEAARELGTIHTSAAQQLLDFVNLRLHREERLTVLAHDLMQPRLGPNPSQTLADFRYVFFNPDSGEPQPNTIHTPLTDWLLFWRNSPDPADAIGAWRQSQSTAWLISALSAVDPKDPAVPGLLTAARKVEREDPAFPSVAYYAVRVSPPAAART